MDVEMEEPVVEKKIVIDPKDTINLNFKVIIHEKCGKKHIDLGKYAEFNHKKHLCIPCNEFFYNTERGIGI